MDGKINGDKGVMEESDTKNALPARSSFLFVVSLCHIFCLEHGTVNHKGQTFH